MKWSDIGGWFSEPEAAAVRQVLRETKRGLRRPIVVVEAGIFLGRSTAVILGCLDGGDKFFSFDPYREGAPALASHPGMTAELAEEQMLANLDTIHEQLWTVPTWWHVQQPMAGEHLANALAVSAVGAHPDFCLIDTDHDYGGTIDAFRTAFAYRCRNFAFHDYKLEGVARAIAEVLERLHQCEVRTVDNTRFLLNCEDEAC